jgi:glycosyltransferase involved in cell wall biosynthesis
MKRIVFIGGVTNFEVIKGGLESVVYNLSTQFTYFPEIEFYLYGNKIKEKSIKNIHFCDLNLPIPFFGLFINFILFGKKMIKQIDEKVKVDVYHFQDTVPNLLLLNSNILYKTVITQHGILKEEMKYQPNILKKIKFLLKELVEQLYLSGAKNLIFISNYNLKYVCEKYPKIKFINYKLIRNPIHPSFFNQEPSNYNDLRLYFVGRLIKLKGLHDLLWALKNLIKTGIAIRLEIIGDFIDIKYKNTIHSILKNSILEEFITFHGWQNTAGIIKISSQCNVFVLPSYQETLPVSIAEAMALGKAVIATRLSGVEEMIEDGKSGFLYKKGSIEEIKEKILFLFNNPQIVKQVGYEASIVARKMFNPQNILLETINFYKQILRND